MQKIKQLFSRFGLMLGTLAIIIAGAAAFSAFEAHVVNVTATIENATDISTSALTYGTVFPQEILHQPVTLSLSSSFAASDALGVDYVIKQKPKCGLPVVPEVVASGTPISYSAYGQVTENAEGVFSCVDPGYVMLPLLCPYISKTSDNAGDTSVPSFHGPIALASWTDAIASSTAAVGHLTKADPSTTWDIDLHVPCFKGQCAQDWASYVHTANPAADPTAYMADPAQEHQQFGCDLWYEVTGVGRTGTSTPPGTGTLTVTKVVVGTSTPASSFSFQVNGGSVTAFEADGSNSMSVAAGNYSVTEATTTNYTTTYSNSLNANTNCTNLAVSSSSTVTCTVTNTLTSNTSTSGSLTVTKVVEGSSTPASSFTLTVDGNTVTSGSSTSVTAGTHTVSEGPHAGFTRVISGNCDANGIVTVPANGSASCTVTNTATNTATTGTSSLLTVTKIVINDDGGTATTSDFSLLVDGASVTSGVATTTTPGLHVVSEGAHAGYDSVIGGPNCDSSGNVTVPASGSASCTITNNDINSN